MRVCDCRYCGRLFVARSPRGALVCKDRPCRLRYNVDRTRPHVAAYSRANRERRRLAEWNRQAAKRASSTGPVDRLEVFTRDGWTCWLCGCSVDRLLTGHDRGGPTVDHVVPLSRGGAHDMANLRLAHMACNAGRGARSAPA